MPLKFKQHVALAFSILGLGCVLTACNEPDESQICEGCSQGEYGYICDITTPAQLQCAASPLAADMQCPGSVVGGEVCGGAPPATSGQGSQDPYGGWDPYDLIYFDRVAQETVIQKELIATIASDGHVLLAQDRARLVEQPAGYYKLNSVHRDDFAYHLGLRTGDTILSANGITLKKLGDYVDALAVLRNATALSITYKRVGTTTTVDFRIE